MIPCLILKMTLPLKVILKGNLCATTLSQIGEHLVSYIELEFALMNYTQLDQTESNMFAWTWHPFFRLETNSTHLSSSQCTCSIRHLVPCPPGNWDQGWFVNPPKKSHACSHHKYQGNVTTPIKIMGMCIALYHQSTGTAVIPSMIPWSLDDLEATTSKETLGCSCTIRWWIQRGKTVRLGPGNIGDQVPMVSFFWIKLINNPILCFSSEFAQCFLPSTWNRLPSLSVSI